MQVAFVPLASSNVAPCGGSTFAINYHSFQPGLQLGVELRKKNLLGGTQTHLQIDFLSLCEFLEISGLSRISNPGPDFSNAESRLKCHICIYIKYTNYCSHWVDPPISESLVVESPFQNYGLPPITLFHLKVGGGQWRIQ